jgi:uncharacterized membrane protein YhdT
MEEKKPKRTGAIIGTIAAILLCGCPGLSLCVLGIWGATGTLPDVWTGYGNFPWSYGIGFLCVALIFIVIAVVVPVLLLRKKKVPVEASPVDVLPPQEPLPPAS